MKQEIDTKKQTEVKAPQAVVHIKHSITLRQYKIWLVILQKYREFYESGSALDADGYYRFSKATLDDLIGYETTKADLKRDLIALRKEDIIISVLEKGGEKAEEGMGFISRWRLSSKTIAIEIPPFLQDVMKGLDQPRAMFQLLNWQIFNHFSGKYEAVIYKLCRDYIGARNTPYMTIPEFREYMGLKKEEYPEGRPSLVCTSKWREKIRLQFHFLSWNKTQHSVLQRCISRSWLRPSIWRSVVPRTSNCA